MKNLILFAVAPMILVIASSCQKDKTVSVSNPATTVNRTSNTAQMKPN